MSTNIRTRLADNVYFNEIQVDRFKTMRLTAIALLPLEKETASDFALLTQVLSRSCKEYPDFTALSKKLSSLYGASLSAGVRKIGESLALTFSIAGIDDRYALKGDVVSSELSNLLLKVIFEPKLIDGVFDCSEVEQERRQLIDLADSEFNDKRVYANARLIENMCKNEAYGIKRYGSRESILKCTPESLKMAWERMLEGASFEVFFVGGASSQGIQEIFKEKFSLIERKPEALNTEIIRKAENVNKVTENMDIAQAKVLMGFRTDCCKDDEDAFAMRLMNVILGSGTRSKFFLNIREKMSLCYYCFSRFNRFKGILTVESGVESSNAQRTVEAVLGELEEVKKGNFTEEDVRLAKLSVASDFLSITDTVTGNEEWYVSQLTDPQFLTVKEITEKLNAVTKDEIIAAAKKLTLDTIYILSGEGEENAD
ncbi:MAG: insulinase family protein [Clostridia bacterium]|nr:insulinase family protein [Clostridia bacterium]